MKLKYHKILFLLIFFIHPFLYGEDGNKQESHITEYKNSVEQNEKIIYQGLNTDIENKVKKALELKFINSKIALQRLQEIIFIYPEFIKDEKNLNFILNEIFNIYVSEKAFYDFELFLYSLKELNIIDQTVEDKYKEKYSSIIK